MLSAWGGICIEQAVSSLRHDGRQKDQRLRPAISLHGQSDLSRAVEADTRARSAESSYPTQIGHRAALEDQRRFPNGIGKGSLPWSRLPAWRGKRAPRPHSRRLLRWPNPDRDRDGRLWNLPPPGI